MREPTTTRLESPSPEEIRAACDDIQRGWSDADRRRRQVMRMVRLPVLEYMCTSQPEVWRARRVG